LTGGVPFAWRTAWMTRLIRAWSRPLSECLRSTGTLGGDAGAAAGKGCPWAREGVEMAEFI
jgi:hypothetical protein